MWAVMVAVISGTWGVFTFNFFPVEVSVTIAGWASESFYATLFTTGHELTTPISGIPSHGSCMVLEAFPVPNHFLVRHMIVVYTCCCYGSAIVGAGDLWCCGRDDIVVVVGHCRMIMMDQVAMSMPMSPPKCTVQWDGDPRLMTWKFHFLPLHFLDKYFTCFLFVCLETKRERTRQEAQLRGLMIRIKKVGCFLKIPGLFLFNNGNGLLSWSNTTHLETIEPSFEHLTPYLSILETLLHPRKLKGDKQKQKT